ncbi:MAG: hypothetical protein LH478_05900, partial [Chitinophagaceae bacterium]|nr:hypothetical protein [Chitinophagaceae bacterium]
THFHSWQFYFLLFSFEFLLLHSGIRGKLSFIRGNSIFYFLLLNFYFSIRAFVANSLSFVAILFFTFYF